MSFSKFIAFVMGSSLLCTAADIALPEETIMAVTAMAHTRRAIIVANGGAYLQLNGKPGNVLDTKPVT